MSDNDRYAELYLSFEDRQEWLAETFAGMTMAEYHTFVGYVFEELNLYGETKEGGEFRRVKGLLLAMARHDLDASHFAQGWTDEQRESGIKAATAVYELARGLYAHEEVAGVEAAWAGSLDHCAKFGWPSPLFGMLQPRQIFREPD